MVSLRNTSERPNKAALRKCYYFGFLPLNLDNEIAQRSRTVLVGEPNHKLK
jgi:hypothetical protein